MENNMERTKQLIEMALAAGRRMQSIQTGFVHYCYQSQDEDVQQAIPVYENVLFVLALLRTRTVENMTEAKVLLEKLLAFQNDRKEKSLHNFPIYLHEYPNCWDHFLGINLLTPFYWILKYFGHVLGQDLKIKLEKSVKDLLTYGLKIQEEMKLPYKVEVRFAASRVAFTTLWDDKNGIEKGNKVLELLHEQGTTDLWDSTDCLSDLLVSLQMVYSIIAESPWKGFWKYLLQTWHYASSTYVGPCVKEKQKREEPLVSLYDYFMGYFSGQYAARTKIMNVCQLRAVLIHPSDDHIVEGVSCELVGLYGNNKWALRNEKEWALTLLEKQEILNPVLDKTYTPFRFAFGDTLRGHALVNQGSYASKIEYQNDEKESVLFFHLEEGADLENRERQRELSFYIDFHPETQILVEGKPSTTFELGQKVEIESSSRKIELLFDCIEGTGQFLGHISRGNRPSQVEVKGDKRFLAYDWHLFIRTIRRKSKCLLRVKIKQT